MSSNPEPLNKDFPLSIDGYPYVDLHQPLRLGDLHKTFEYSERQHDVGLFAEFLACQGENISPQIISDLLVRMAPCVGKFIANTFSG